MKLHSYALALLCSLSLPVAAHADSLVTYDIIATLQSGTISGTVTLDENTGLFTDADILATYDGVNYDFVGAPALVDIESNYARFHFADAVIPDAYFGVDVSTSPLTGFTGGPLCSADAECAGEGPLAGDNVLSAIGTGVSTPTDEVVEGSLVPTPEPSSLILLGTGALGLIEPIRRRLRRA